MPPHNRSICTCHECFQYRLKLAHCYASSAKPSNSTDQASPYNSRKAKKAKVSSSTPKPKRVHEVTNYRGFHSSDRSYFASISAESQKQFLEVYERRLHLSMLNRDLTHITVERSKLNKEVEEVSEAVISNVSKVTDAIQALIQAQQTLQSSMSEEANAREVLKFANDEVTKIKSQLVAREKHVHLCLDNFYPAVTVNTDLIAKLSVYEFTAAKTWAENSLTRRSPEAFKRRVLFNNFEINDHDLDSIVIEEEINGDTVNGGKQSPSVNVEGPDSNSVSTPSSVIDNVHITEGCLEKPPSVITGHSNNGGTNVNNNSGDSNE